MYDITTFQINTKLLFAQPVIITITFVSTMFGRFCVPFRQLAHKFHTKNAIV